MSGAPAFGHFRGLGTSVSVGAADPTALDEVVAVVKAEIDACDRACSRFRRDSELSRLNAGQRPAVLSEWLCAAVATALDAARATYGLVDPTIGQCLIDLGYDRSFDRIDPSTPLVLTAAHVPAWRHVTVDRAARRVSLPPRVRLDLGATAKALCADRAAARAARSTGSGVVVSLGGDIAVSGPAPDGGWVVLVTDRADPAGRANASGGAGPAGLTSPAGPAVPAGLPTAAGGPAGAEATQTVSISTGALATSGTAARRWARAGTVVHHLVDPRTGRPATERWRTVSVAASSCVAANTASTAAVILGSAAPDWLQSRGFDARLVTPAGSVVRTGHWPADPGPAPRPDPIPVPVPVPA